MSGHTTIVELKRPDHTINRDDENQAIKYRDDLQNQFQRISIVLVGKGKVSTMNAINDREHIEVLSYHELIARSRSRLTWLINDLKTTPAI